MRRCPNCGEQVAESAKFCPECGHALAPRAAPREERKVVTVVFCDLVGSTAKAEQLDPEDVRALLSVYYEQVRAELERFGGTVEKFIGDAVMAVFGAPLTHEDDPERAVRAALAVRDAAARDGALQVRIAVHTGEALVAVDARASEVTFSSRYLLATCRTVPEWVSRCGDVLRDARTRQRRQLSRLGGGVARVLRPQHKPRRGGRQGARSDQ